MNEREIITVSNQYGDSWGTGCREANRERAPKQKYIWRNGIRWGLKEYNEAFGGRVYKERKIEYVPRKTGAGRKGLGCIIVHDEHGMKEFSDRHEAAAFLGISYSYVSIIKKRGVEVKGWRVIR